MTHSGGQPHAVGDRGQRYEVSFFNPTTNQRQTLGWADDAESAQRMADSVEKHPSWQFPQITDRCMSDNISGGDEIVGHKTFSDGHGGFRHEPLTRAEGDAIIAAADDSGRAMSGGPAFPIHPAMPLPPNEGIPPIGMTLRDYFAAHAPAMTEQWWMDSGGAQRHWIDAQAAFSYAHADAMMKARKA